MSTEVILTATKTDPTWNKTFGPMQKKQSTMRKAKIMGMLLIYLRTWFSTSLQDPGARISQAEEPRQRCNGQLYIDSVEVIVDHGETLLNERLEDSLVQQGPMHRGTVVAG